MADEFVCCIGGEEIQQRCTVTETQLNSDSSIDCLLMIVDRVSRDVTRHVTSPDDDVRFTTPASAAGIHHSDRTDE